MRGFSSRIEDCRIVIVDHVIKAFIADDKDLGVQVIGWS